MYEDGVAAAEEEVDEEEEAAVMGAAADVEAGGVVEEITGVDVDEEDSTLVVLVETAEEV